jgi:hypothetical protein
VGTKHAHARFVFRHIVLRNRAGMRVIRFTSIDCVKVFAPNANAAHHRGANCEPNFEHRTLTLRNRERYKGRSGASFGAPSDSDSSNCLNSSPAPEPYSSFQGDVL